MIDDEDKEIYILSDLNHRRRKLKIRSLYESHQMSQLIKKATRVTVTTSDSGVLHTGI